MRVVYPMEHGRYSTVIVEGVEGEVCERQPSKVRELRLARRREEHPVCRARATLAQPFLCPLNLHPSYTFSAEPRRAPRPAGQPRGRGGEATTLHARMRRGRAPAMPARSACACRRSAAVRGCLYSQSTARGARRRICSQSPNSSAVTRPRRQKQHSTTASSRSWCAILRHASFRPPGARQPTVGHGVSD